MTDREKALMRVQTMAFALTEANLYLDTHPDDIQALNYYHKAVSEYNDAVNTFINNFGPLDITQVQSTSAWTWVEGCMPWEGECNVEI